MQVEIVDGDHNRPEDIKEFLDVVPSMAKKACASWDFVIKHSTSPNFAALKVASPDVLNTLKEFYINGFVNGFHQGTLNAIQMMDEIEREKKLNCAAESN